MLEVRLQRIVKVDKTYFFARGSIIILQSVFTFVKFFLQITRDERER